MEIERSTPVSETLVVTVNALVQLGDDQDNVDRKVTVSKGTALDTAVRLQLGRTKGYTVVSVRKQTAHEASWAEFD